jgi:hypothetical protein
LPVAGFEWGLTCERNQELRTSSAIDRLKELKRPRMTLFAGFDVVESKQHLSIGAIMVHCVMLLAVVAGKE